MSILAETGHEGFPKAVFHLLPGLSSVPLDEAETVVSTQVKIVEIGDVVNMERPRRSIVVEDLDCSRPVLLLVIAGDRFGVSYSCRFFFGWLCPDLFSRERNNSTAFHVCRCCCLLQ